MLAVLEALASSHRLRILAALHAEGAIHVSRLARTLNLSRPLAHLHLRKLAAAGLVTSRHELSADGKALAMYEIVPFELRLDPGSIAAAAAILPSDPKPESRGD